MELQDTLDKISQLQGTEEQLYKALTQNAENVALGKPNTFSDTEIQDITTQINSLSAARVNLYNTLSETYKSEALNETNAQEALQQQTQTLQLLEQELNKSKKKMAAMHDEKANQLKMIEITTYYSKQYDAHRRLMRMIAIVGVCILIAIGLETMYEPLGVVTKPLVILICIVGGFFIIRRIIYMLLRRTDNYDEFVWPMAPTNDTQLLTANDAKSLIDISGVEIPFVCAASSCCNVGTVWTDSSGCIVDTTVKDTTS
jgi:hypothetical protein